MVPFGAPTPPIVVSYRGPRTAVGGAVELSCFLSAGSVSVGPADRTTPM